MEEGRGPGAFAEAVVAGELLEATGGGFGDDEGPVVGEDDELALGEDEGPAEVGVGPEGFPGFKIEAAEVAFDFLFVNGAIDAVEVGLVKDGWVDVVLELFVGPDGLA